MVSVHDVAAYILARRGQMSAMKLQKLVYYCQAWSLVWDDSPMFCEPIEAWINGPVVRSLYEEYRGVFLLSKATRGDPSKLSEQQRGTIEAVLGFYGDKSPQWLSDLTHMERPWKKAREGLAPDQRGTCEISLESMADYYSSLQPK